MRDPLTIAIDYDDTFTADTNAWTSVIKMLQSYGHFVICVSARLDSFNQRQELESALPAGVKVFLSYCTQKKEFVEKLGMRVDIWIDDCPEAIVTKKDVKLMFE